LTPKGLAQLLVSKHDNLMKRYSLELSVGERVSVLREKKDQLKYWVSSKKTDEVRLKELAAVEDELKKLENSGLLKPVSYYKDLKSKISEHSEAKNFWSEKAKGVSS